MSQVLPASFQIFSSYLHQLSSHRKVLRDIYSFPIKTKENLRSILYFSKIHYSTIFKKIIFSDVLTPEAWKAEKFLLAVGK
jgi:hypothetical protein